MRIGLIQLPETEQGFYASYISHLLTEYAQWLGYKLVTIHTIKEIPQDKDNTLFIIENENAGLQKLFFERHVQHLLQHIGCEICINLTRYFFKKINLPHLFVLQEINLLNKGKKNFLASIIPSSKERNTKIFSSGMQLLAYAHCAKENFEAMHPGFSMPVQIVPFTASPEMKALEWPDRVLIKAQYAGNREYFLCMGDGDEAMYIEILKGFSKFKKWQQSSMQLVLVLDETDWLESFLEKLITYRYKEDVVIIREINETQLAGLFAAAYSFIHASRQQENLEAVVSALQCAMPLICMDLPTYREYAGESALYLEGFMAMEVSKHLIGIYKNENFRAQMAQVARDTAYRYNQETEKVNLWRFLESLIIQP